MFEKLLDWNLNDMRLKFKPATIIRINIVQFSRVASR